MLRYKIISVTVLIVFFFGMATLNCVLAGEKMQVKSHAVIHTVKFEQIEVGDTPGHIMAIMESKGISIDEITGMKLTSRGVATMDINPNAGGVTMQEYVIETDKDGDKMIVKSEGKSVSKDQYKEVKKQLLAEYNDKSKEYDFDINNAELLTAVLNYEVQIKGLEMTGEINAETIRNTFINLLQ